MSTNAAPALHTTDVDLADEIMTLVGKHPRSVAVDALSHVVGLLCLTRSADESRASLADFLSTAELKRDNLQQIFAGRSPA